MPQKFVFSGDRLRHAMEFLGLTQAEFASRVGTKQYNISRWLYEQFDPSAPLLRAMADATGLPMSYFMLAEGEPAWPVDADVMKTLEAARGSTPQAKAYRFDLERLRLALDETGMRQVDIAERLGLKQGNLSRMLNTPDYTPRSSLLAAMADLTGKQMEWFMVESPVSAATK